MWRSTARFSGPLPLRLRAWSSFMLIEPPVQPVRDAPVRAGDRTESRRRHRRTQSLKINRT